MNSSFLFIAHSLGIFSRIGLVIPSFKTKSGDFWHPCRKLHDEGVHAVFRGAIRKPTAKWDDVYIAKEFPDCDSIGLIAVYYLLGPLPRK